MSALFAVAHCGPLNALLTSGAAAGPIHAAAGPLVATKRGWRDINLEGYSEDDNQDGFVDPIGQVAPVAYAHPVHYAAPVAPVVKTVAAPVVKTVAAPVVQHVAAPVLSYAHHAPVTYTHTVHAGNLVHTVNHPAVYGGFLGHPVLAAAPAAEEKPAEDAMITDA